MSNPINNGGPAFPYAFEHDDPPQSGFAPGMTLRDWFASKAANRYAGMVSETGCEYYGIKTKLWPAKVVAAASYALADAMLAERAKGGAA